ncbi:MAG: HRDC domain-containing protein [Actinomycetes bacterium]
MSEEVPVESTPLNEPRLPVVLVETDELLQQVIDSLGKTAKPIAIDAERASGFRYGQKAYLIQIAIEGNCIYLIDPISPFSSEVWTEFTKIANTKAWIIHAASQDLACLAEIGLVPTKLLDTELASRILGLPRVALGTITEHYLSIKLAKEHSAVDWSERPLPKSWLDYAALDVDVLAELWTSVEKDLIEKNRMGIAQEEFDHLLTPNVKEPKLERWRSITGLHEIKDQRSLTIAKYLWEAREDLAISRDIAPGRLIPDASIVAAIKANPKSKPELASLRTFYGKASRTFIDIWWKAFSEGTTTKKLVELRPKSTGIPNHRNWPQKFPEANARLLTCKAMLTKVAEEMSIPAENIVSPDVIRSLCFEPPTELTTASISEALTLKKVRPWQIAAIAEFLVVALAAVTPPELPKAETDSD